MFVEWREVPSYPWLEASSDGRVRWQVDSFDGRVRKGREIAGSISSRGYVVLCINRGAMIKRNVGKHVLVCEAFYGRRPSPRHECAHWDGDRTNNQKSNLRWATKKANAADRKRHGRDHYGNQHSCAKLSADDVFEVRRLRALGYRGSDVASLIDANKHHLNKIASWRAWSSIGCDGCDNAILSFGG